jgi:hypothetical protein
MAAGVSPILRLDPRLLPACHICGAPCVVAQGPEPIPSATWYHEHGCKVLNSRRQRIKLEEALARSFRREGST